MTSEVQKRADIRYRQTEKCKATKIRHAQSEEYKAVVRRYAQTEKGKAVRVRHDRTEKGKLTDARHQAKRKELGYNPHNNWFNGCNGHHIDKENVLFIPAELHKSIRHQQDDLKSMKEINNVAYEWLCIQEII